MFSHLVSAFLWALHRLKQLRVFLKCTRWNINNPAGEKVQLTHSGRAKNHSQTHESTQQQAVSAREPWSRPPQQKRKSTCPAPSTRPKTSKSSCCVVFLFPGRKGERNTWNVLKEEVKPQHTEDRGVGGVTQEATLPVNLWAFSGLHHFLLCSLSLVKGETLV